MLIDGDRIAEPDGRPADVVVDGAGKTLLPGLIDAHTHTFDGNQAGVPLLAGTDATPFAPVHGESLHRELVLLTQGGLTNEDALAAATSVPAHHFGLTDRGRIAPGLCADLLLVDGDPTRDVSATRSIVDVWRCGVRQLR